MSSTKNKKSDQPKKPQQPKLVVPSDLEAHYANLVRIAHSPSEMVFDFARLLPGNLHAPVVARILMSPLSAKLFQHALSENLTKYEATFGEIVIPKKQSLADNLFRSLQPPEAPEE
jgi:hypothetical protein